MNQVLLYGPSPVDNSGIVVQRLELVESRPSPAVVGLDAAPELSIVLSDVVKESGLGVLNGELAIGIGTVVYSVSVVVSLIDAVALALSTASVVRAAVSFVG